MFRVGGKLKLYGTGSLKGLSVRCDDSCLRRSLRLGKRSGQPLWEQGKGLSYWWVLLCLANEEVYRSTKFTSLNALLQPSNGHLLGFSPVWVLSQKKLPEMNLESRSLHKSLSTALPFTFIGPFIQVNPHMPGDICSSHKSFSAVRPSTFEPSFLCATRFNFHGRRIHGRKHHWKKGSSLTFCTSYAPLGDTKRGALSLPE